MLSLFRVKYSTISSGKRRVTFFVANAETYGEDGGFCYDETDYESLGITLGQMKGYLGQLVKKGYITACEGCYFTHFIVAND